MIAKVKRTTQPPQAFVPPRFQESVKRHMLGNLSGDVGTPLLQLWYAPPGSGKTFGLRAILAVLRVRVHLFDAADYESRDAGEPSRRLLELFETGLADVRGQDG